MSGPHAQEKYPVTFGVLTYFDYKTQDGHRLSLLINKSAFVFRQQSVSQLFRVIRVSHLQHRGFSSVVQNAALC